MEIYQHISKLKTDYTSDELSALCSLSSDSKENLSALTYHETEEVKILLYFNWILNDFNQTLQVINGTQIISDLEYERAEKLISIFTLKFLRRRDDLQQFDIFTDLNKFLLGITELFYTITKLSIRGSHDFYKKEVDFNSARLTLIDSLLAKDLNSILMKHLCKDLLQRLIFTKRI